MVTASTLEITGISHLDSTSSQGIAGWEVPEGSLPGEKTPTHGRKSTGSINCDFFLGFCDILKCLKAINIYITFIKHFWQGGAEEIKHVFIGDSVEIPPFYFSRNGDFFPWNPPWNPPCFHVFSTCFLWWISVKISQHVNKHDIFQVKKHTCEFPLWFSTFFSPFKLNRNRFRHRCQDDLQQQQRHGGQFQASIRSGDRFGE